MIIAYTALHYGACYLPYAMMSVIDHVDRYVVLYSADGSHGTKAQHPLPPGEDRDTLYKLARAVAGKKLNWIDGTWTHEGQQRDAILEICPDADMILVVDYDEIWPDPKRAIRAAMATEAHDCRLPMIHFWRSFRRCVLHDPAFPVRIIQTSAGGAEQTLSSLPPIAHLGYAIPDKLMAYKRHIHGHRAEWRTDIDWMRERWFANAQFDCHPVGSEWWNPEPVNPDEYLPGYMRCHRFYWREVIT